MKIPISAIAGVLVLAVSAWCVKHSMDTHAVESAVAPQSAKPASGMVELQDASVENLPPSRNATMAKSAPLADPTPEPVHYGMTQETQPASPSTLSSNPVGNPTGSYESQRGSSPVANRSAVQPTTSASTGALPQTAVSLNGNSAASDPSVIELDPGVPAPTALMPPPGNQSPAAAAAQQQLADSFVQDVNAALNQPGTTDAAASDSYFNLLDKANEQYRALYGNDAYNGASLKAGMDAQAGM